jgi:hypothetical protein
VLPEAETFGWIPKRSLLIFLPPDVLVGLLLPKIFPLLESSHKIIFGCCSRRQISFPVSGGHAREQVFLRANLSVQQNSQASNFLRHNNLLVMCVLPQGLWKNL